MRNYILSFKLSVLLNQFKQRGTMLNYSKLIVDLIACSVSEKVIDNHNLPNFFLSNFSNKAKSKISTYLSDLKDK